LVKYFLYFLHLELEQIKYEAQPGSRQPASYRELIIFQPAVAGQQPPSALSIFFTFFIWYHLLSFVKTENR
jgi:hypothetical protein